MENALPSILLYPIHTAFKMPQLVFSITLPSANIYKLLKKHVRSHFSPQTPSYHLLSFLSSNFVCYLFLLFTHCTVPRKYDADIFVNVCGPCNSPRSPKPGSLLILNLHMKAARRQKSISFLGKRKKKLA